MTLSRFNIAKKALLISLTLFMLTLFSPVHGNDSLILSKSEWQKHADRRDYTETYKTIDWKAKDNPGRFKFNLKFNYEIFMVIAVILLAGLLILLIKRLSKHPYQANQTIKREEFSKLVSDIEENFLNSDLESLLNEAQRLNDYKSVIRLLYCKSIKKLHNEGIIIWTKEKTNGQLSRELKDINLKDAFLQLTRDYEYTWFGTSPATEEKAETMKSNYNSFKSMIQTV